MVGEHAGGWVQAQEPIEASEFARRLEALGPTQDLRVSSNLPVCMQSIS